MVVRGEGFALNKVIINVRISFLEDVVQGVKSSHKFNEIESLIDELIENVGKIRQNKETNSAAEQKQIIECEIRELRTKVNNHLDKLQEDLMKELTEAETTITEKTCTLMASLNESEKRHIFTCSSQQRQSKSNQAFM